MPQKLSNLPNGALLKFGKHQVGSEAVEPIIWSVADKNHSGYPANSVSLITEKIIDLRSYDAKESGGQGNLDYSLSNINQWLNSDGSAGNWYSPTHSGDTSPDASRVGMNPYASRAGFLYNFTSAERLALLPTTLTVQTSGSTYKSIVTKVFLPSEKELRGTSDYTDNSSRFELFNSVDYRAVLTNQAFANVSNQANKPSTITDFWFYLTRNITSNRVRAINSGNNLSEIYPYDGHIGVRPVINLSTSTKISDTTDSDGCYTVLSQTIPEISGMNTNLGVIKQGISGAEVVTSPYLDGSLLGFKYTYVVDDIDDDDSVTVTEYIDNAALRSYVATKESMNTFDVTGNTWSKLTNGVHTLKITATDGVDTVTRTITFTKSVTKLIVQKSSPIKASERPSRIVVTLVKNVPYNSNVKVEVCNNGFDTNPTWEEIDTYESGLAHTFANHYQENGWGVNIRVTVDRNGGEGACYISEIGGNFE